MVSGLAALTAFRELGSFLQRTRDMHTLAFTGESLSNYFELSSRALAFARTAALDGDACWALAVGVATLAGCLPGEATISLRCVGSSVSVTLRGRFYEGSREIVALTVSRLRARGFRVPWPPQDVLLELQTEPTRMAA